MPGRGRRLASATRLRADPERGTATAELAVVLPAVVLVAVLGVWSVLVGTAQLRCVDAAGVGARALARGEPVDVVRSVVAALAPPGARVQLRADARLVVVEVRASIPVPGPWPGAVAVGDSAVAWAEGAVSPSTVPGG